VLGVVTSSGARLLSVLVDCAAGQLVLSDAAKVELMLASPRWSRKVVHRACPIV
jgi:hypothetical protein